MPYLTRKDRVAKDELHAQGLRLCGTCKVVKPLSDFGKLTRDRYGYQTRCRSCWKSSAAAYTQSGAARLSRLKHVYGLTPERLDELGAAQGGLCAICGRPPGAGGFHIDHDHACCPGKKSCGSCIRALLCALCNQGLGQFQDDPVRLRAAADYIERTTPSRTETPSVEPAGSAPSATTSGSGSAAT